MASGETLRRGGGGGGGGSRRRTRRAARARREHQALLWKSPLQLRQRPARGDHPRVRHAGDGRGAVRQGHGKEQGVRLRDDEFPGRLRPSHQKPRRKTICGEGAEGELLGQAQGQGAALPGERVQAVRGEPVVVGDGGELDPGLPGLWPSRRRARHLRRGHRALARLRLRLLLQQNRDGSRPPGARRHGARRKADEDQSRPGQALLSRTDEGTSRLVSLRNFGKKEKRRGMVWGGAKRLNGSKDGGAPSPPR